MKKYGKILLVAGLVVAFAVAGVAATGVGMAADAPTLDGNQSWTGDNDFTGTGNWFKDIAIGSTVVGVGGTTGFNGTMYNGSVDADGDDIAVTVGDNMRVDGYFFRTQVGGDDPLKFADTLRPESTDYDLGTSSMMWGDMYLSGTAYVNGNVTQDRGDVGTVKSLASVGSDGTIARSVENVDDASTTVTVTRNSAGNYTVDFGFQVSDRYIQLTAVSDGVTFYHANYAAGAATDQITVYTADATGALADAAFDVTVF